ncbi:MAG: DUF971 domain-containing protein [Chloroflexi bacterium]|nr:DUF971 domain-containing protein [Chloroflexota bacterium]
MTAQRPPPAIPKEVRIAKGGDALVVLWQDGHQEVVPFAFLRGACPCATCKGSHRQIDLSRVVPKPGVSLVDYETLGRYALRLLWSDAHQTGIYTYTYLRSLCRCPECHPPTEGTAVP